MDEVADLPLHMQVKLLRAIQEKSVRPVGEAKEFQVNLRILCATHKDLVQGMSEGRFRQDLFYRLNVIEAHVPPLRDRQDDIPALVDHILDRLKQSMGHFRTKGQQCSNENTVQLSLPRKRKGTGKHTGAGPHSL